jgi:hypothetical protein
MKRGKSRLSSAARIRIFYVILAGVCLWCVGSGIYGLLSGSAADLSEAYGVSLTKGDWYKGEVKYGSQEYTSIKHTINLIPVGTEHFYLIYSDSGEQAVMVRACSNFGKNFDTYTYESKKNLTVKGEVKQIPKGSYSTGGLFSGDYEYINDNYYYIDLLSTRYYILRILFGLLTPCLGVWCVSVVKNGGKAAVRGSKTALIIVLLTVADLCLALHLMNIH